MDKFSYHRRRYPSIVIQKAIWFYFRFSMSYRDVEDMLAERGIDVSCETSPPLGFGVRRHHCTQAGRCDCRVAPRQHRRSGKSTGAEVRAQINYTHAITTRRRLPPASCLQPHSHAPVSGAS